jgi:hypothetical protein
MNYLNIAILVLFLLSGCASGNFSVYEGRAKFSIPFDWPKPQKKGLLNQLDLVYVGMSKPDLYELFGGFKLRGHQEEGNQEWITFSTQEKGGARDSVTFYLLDGKVIEW